MFEKILIANRGEIACRIIRTAKRLGIKTVAIYSDADSKAQHVRMADEAYYIGKSPAQESYLKGEAIVSIAIETGAAAIHPGYGFLSENAKFARLCEKAGVIFIGPTSDAIQAMGSKSAAKQLMQEANVPLVPGYHGDKQDLTTFTTAAKALGYPVLLKAAAGGGGKGMRIIENETAFENELASAKREASKNFGDDKMLLEKYLAKPRHIEVQIFADKYGNYVYLFERDCSIQRRHQKIIEEAPAPGLPEKLRVRMGNVAMRAAQAIYYVGAGTVEFLLDEGGKFYFMEMNTRLQVEHPVTEMITGYDLVEWQLSIAKGDSLPLRQEDLHIDGHAIEVRIYAEDPYNDFLPAVGQIQHLQTPATSEHVRIDSGVCPGDQISTFYDPMIAKLIVWGEDREAAWLRMKDALANYHLLGVKNNVRFLQEIIKHRDYKLGKVDTHFISNHQDTLFKQTKTIPESILLAASLYRLLKRARVVAERAQGHHDPNSPWYLCDGFRLNMESEYELRFIVHDQSVIINCHFYNSYYLLELNGHKIKVTGFLNNSNRLAVTIHEQQQFELDIVEHGKQLYLLGYEIEYHLLIDDPTSAYSQAQETRGSLYAPMPGTVVALMVGPGKFVTCGDSLMVIEAMKMEHTIQAPKDGVVKSVHYHIGDGVDEGAELLTLEI